MSSTAKIANQMQARDASPALCSVPAEAMSVDAAGTETPVTWQLPEEVPIALLINSEPYTVMMATPANLTDFGRGFVLAVLYAEYVFLRMAKIWEAQRARKSRESEQTP